MQIYLKYIAKLVNCNPAITSIAVWTNLCEIFDTHHSQHPFHQPIGCHLSLARTFATASLEQSSEPNFFSDTLNVFFNSFPLESTHEFTIMLRAFLTCYPEHLAGLREDIAATVNVRAYHLPLLLTDLNAIAADLEHACDFKQKFYLIKTCQERFSTSHIAKIFLQLNNSEFYKKWNRWDKQLFVPDLIRILWERYPDPELENVLPLMLNSLADQEIYDVKMLVEIINNENFDFSRLTKHLIEKFPHDNIKDKKFTIELLENIFNNFHVYQSKVLAIARFLLSDPDIITRCELLVLLGKFSDDVTELIEHLPLLINSLQNEDDSVRMVAKEALEISYQRLQILAENSIHNHAIILTRLPSMLDIGFVYQCNILILLSKIDYDPVHLSINLLALLTKLQDTDKREMLLAIEAIVELCEKCTMHIPAVIAALNTTLLSVHSEVQARTCDALAILASKVTADYRSVIPNLLILAQSTNLEINNCAFNALGQLLISSVPEVPMLPVVSIVVRLLTYPAYNVIEQHTIEFIREITLYRQVDYTQVINALVPKIENGGWDRDYYDSIIIALGRIGKQPGADATTMIPVLVGNFIEEDNYRYDSLIEALLNICENEENIPRVNLSILNLIGTAHWSFVGTLVDILTNYFELPASFDFGYWIDYAISRYDHFFDEEHGWSFGLLASFFKRTEIDKPKILSFFLKCLDHYDEDVRLSAIHHISEIEKYFDNKARLDVIAALSTRLYDSERYVRDAAFKELDKMSKRLFLINNIQNEEELNAESKQDEIKEEESKEEERKDTHDGSQDIEIKSADETSKNKRKFMQRESELDWDDETGITTIGRWRGWEKAGRGRGNKWIGRSRSPMHKRSRIDDPALQLKSSTSLAETAVDALVKAIESENPEVKGSAMDVFNDTTLYSSKHKVIIANAYLIELDDPHAYRIERAIGRLLQVALQENSYIDTILPALTQKLTSEYLSTRSAAVSAITTLAKTKLTNQQKDYLVYGLLVHKLHATQHPLLRMAVLEAIEVVCRHRELDFYLHCHLKVSELATTVKDYLHF